MTGSKAKLIIRKKSREIDVVFGFIAAGVFLKSSKGGEGG